MFAAYAKKSDDNNRKTQDEKKDVKENDWLSNSSFAINSNVLSNIQGVTDTDKCDPQSVQQNKGNADTITQPKSDDSVDSPSTPPGSPPKSRGSSSSLSDRHQSPTRDQNQDIVYLSDSSDENSARKKNPKSEKRNYSSSSDSSTSISSREGRSRGSQRIKERGNDKKERKRDKSHRSRRRSRSRKHRYESRSHSRERKESSRHHKHKREQKRKRSRSNSSSSSLDSYGKTNKYKNEARSTKASDVQSQIFYEDKVRAFGNLNVTTLSRPAIAWYRTSRWGLGLPKHFSLPSKKRTLKHRYYNKIIKEIEADLTSRKKMEISNADKNVGQIQGDVHDVEEEISKETAKFNHDLTEDPTDIDLWKKYVQFQDVVHQFERVYRRGGGAAGARVTSERKLAILDKALKENPKCEELLRERCQLAESVLPSDKLTSELKALLGTDPGNLVLWEALIMASQGSLSACRVPAVKSLYQEALKNIQSLRRGNSESAKLIESKLIDLVLHLGLFLRQAGLLELMWSLISVYLEFNIAKLDPTKFHITNTVADNALTELEEAILGSQLPLSTLWLRVETLRAGTHWVPLQADAESEDPQRLVFPEDVNDLIHPINCPHLTFRLVTVTLSLLKVPILPWRESAAKAAGLHPLPWLLDGPEQLYASLLPLGTLEFKETSTLLLDASQLASGPQYLIARPGQDEYIDFLTQVFSACSDCLPSSQKTYLLVWWLRFYRWLMQLERLGHCKLPRGRKKKMRTMAKDLLRHESNRSNLLLFKEFALLELENGSVDGAKKVLQGSISALPISKPVSISEDRAYICALYRTLVEVHLSYAHTHQENNMESSQSHYQLKSEDRKKALCLLVSLGRGTPVTNDMPSNTDIAAALSKFHHITREALDNPSEESLDPFIAPDVCHIVPTFLVEWAACHGWLLFLSGSIWKAAVMIENILLELKVSPSTSSETSDNNSSSTHENFVGLQREALLETYISLLRHHCFETRGSFSILREAIVRGLKEFPGNLTFSAALADLETSNSGTGLPLWRLSKLFYEFNSAPAHVLFVFVMRYRLKQQESAAHRANALLNHGGPDLPDPNTRNRMSTLLKKLTRHPIMRRCPMLWRLRLQFSAAVSTNDEDCSNTFYLALQDCPWAKALYMDIVQVLPTQLAQVQDLLVEKELRLHVTPEELEILRIDT